MPIAKTVAIVANGSIENLAYIAERIKMHDRIIAVDGGLIYCDQIGLIPEFIIGDLDSISKDLRNKYSNTPLKKFPCEKDETDLELALQEVCKSEVEYITLFGALGKRIDHSLYNLNLICLYNGLVRIETEYERLFQVISPARIPCSPGQTISFIPVTGPVKGIISKGLKWELNNAIFEKGFMSISNICLNDFVEISFEQGDLICVLPV